MLQPSELKFKSELHRRDTNATRYIVIHHSKVPSRHTVDDIHRWHLKRGWDGIGYHFFIDKEGVIHNGRPVWAIGAHAYGYNSSSIGICLEGDFNRQQVNEKQLFSTALLVALLCIRYKRAAVVRHCDPTKKKSCPGKHFPFKTLLYKVSKYRSLLNPLFSESCPHLSC